jgi:hypothetical protein
MSKTLIGKVLVGAIAALALTASSASAKIVCNEDGDCWRVKKYREYPPEAKIRVYEDDWKLTDGSKSRWREPGHDRPGYWRGGVWFDL